MRCKRVFFSICRRPAPRAAALSLLAAAAFAAAPSRYAGEQTRPIKTLAPERVEGLLSGAGLGYAKAAELNGWPGPLHALELGEALALSDDQVRALQAVREQMLAEAVPLGRELVAAERALDALFRSSTVDPDAVADATARAARIEARLRAVHLNAHLKTAPLLSRHQRHRYGILRGYTADGHGDGAHGHR